MSESDNSKSLFITFQQAASLGFYLQHSTRSGVLLDDAAGSQGDGLVVLGPVARVARVVGVPSPVKIVIIIIFTATQIFFVFYSTKYFYKKPLSPLSAARSLRNVINRWSDDTNYPPTLARLHPSSALQLCLIASTTHLVSFFNVNIDN